MQRVTRYASNPAAVGELTQAMAISIISSRVEGRQLPLPAASISGHRAFILAIFSEIFACGKCEIIRFAKGFISLKKALIGIRSESFSEIRDLFGYGLHSPAELSQKARRNVKRLTKEQRIILCAVRGVCYLVENAIGSVSSMVL